VPVAIPPERLDRYGARKKLQRYPGLKEEYYLAAFEPDESVLSDLGLDTAQPIAVVRNAAGRLAVSPLREQPVRRRAGQVARVPDGGASACRVAARRTRRISSSPGADHQVGEGDQ